MSDPEPSTVMRAECDLLRQMFEAAVEAAMPDQVIDAHLPDPPPGRTLVVGAGKASAAMARALEIRWKGAISGLVVTRYGHAVACDKIEIAQASHPVPDAAGELAAKRIMKLVQGLGKDDLLIALISGGGSALLSLAAPGISLEDKQAVNRALLTSGTAIGDMNVLRKHISAVKGGRLAAAAWPARCISLMISDVPGDDPGTIASGPTVADGSTLKDARMIAAGLGDAVPETVIKALSDPANESPKLGDVRLSRTENIVVAAPMKSLEAASELARHAGLTPIILGDAIEGEARDIGRAMAAEALERQRNMAPESPPLVLISGGETTVTLRGKGNGGRNVEFLMGLAEALQGAPGICAIACDTDGMDGAMDVAGAIVIPETLIRAKTLNYPVEAALDTNDGHGFFARLQDQVVTGPTLTNVNDFRAIYVSPLSET